MRRRDSIRSLATAAVLAAMLAAAGPAAAGTLYRWVTEDGTLAFADDPKRVPERYRESAEEIQTQGGLDGYERFTPTDAAAQQVHEERLAERLGRLRGEEALQDEGALVEAAPDAGGASVGGIALGVSETTRRSVRNQTNPRNRFRYQAPEQTLPVIEMPRGDDEEPVVVEEIQIKDWEGFTRRARIVRQGDRIISIVKSPKNHFNPRDIIRESELER